MAKRNQHVNAVVEFVKAELWMYPDRLRQMGYTKREMEAAVRQGRLRWAKDGSLQLA